MTAWATASRLRKLASALVALVVTVLVFGQLVAPTTATSASPTVEFDGVVNVSTSTAATAEVTISDGTLVLTGTATDPDGVSHLTIAREYEYHDDTEGRDTEIDRYYASPQASNGSFRAKVPLGTGTNEVNVSVVDEQGYPTKLDLVVHVEDDEAPTPTRLSATRDGKWVRVEGWVSDNVQVAEVRAAGQTIQTQTGKRDLDREDVRLDHRVPRPDAANVTVVLVDHAGNSREVVLPLGGEQPATATPTPTPTPTEQPVTAASSTATATPTAAPTSTATAAATPPPVTTPTPTPDQSGSSLLGLLGVIVVVGSALAMLSIGGGGF
jgi:hypothetical protein